MFQNGNSDRGLSLSSLRELADEELVRLLIDGNHDAMQVIFDRYYRMVMKTAMAIVRDSGEAQDVVQIVFIDFYRQAKNFDSRKGSLKTWLLQYSYGRGINRKQSLQSRNFYDQPDLEKIDPGAYSVWGKILDLESPEAARLIEQVLSMLNDHQRAVIEMVCFQGFTLAETARATGESLGNVQHAYFRGIEKLRSYLRDADERRKRQFKSSRGASFFRGLRRVAGQIKETEVEIVKARAL